MTVQELIGMLQKMPPEAPVKVYREGYAICAEEKECAEPHLNDDGEVEL